MHNSGPCDFLPKPGKGKGSVAKNLRDKKRAYNNNDKTQMLKNQGGKCASCGNTKQVSEIIGHHKIRHADGGATNLSNGAGVCKTCHTTIHQEP